MRIHKAGFSVITVALLISGTLMTVLVLTKMPTWVLGGFGLIFFLLLAFIFRFFRFPNRKIEFDETMVVSPADGTIVAIEEVEENEFIKEKRIQISIFMSVWNVHINWYPVVGKILQSIHFDGKYMAAWLPKSSHENERSVVVIDTPKAGKILVKQIAGAVARRIITYAKPELECHAGDQLGFIRFGSRVDVLIPIGSEIKVQLNQKVTGGLTLLAKLPHS
ncbi:MAG TPA: phosphatidylserine decarboxylase family protein [Marinilabiliales bacterium]|nr:MAG: phosphatidylserine decarboxylase [Bacteroidetes bacterium GWC2_40_13]OFX72333.1 MAG: phosphatidylserine decarboxylase [Bacteroidetes bacterium GWD2_40_43]OFX90420.1 MAG: phosphatidylserine decarboxylase [Bacteroidetes bacterium GWE2_40_63]OFY17335.1 MAG: phosphatidylserine decarboxylase [Bacteroidetes bacterium GWF2_40_13]HAN00908.1 phosphatidylserine decarboxylase family protein [Marinilabiliales bacterium]